jgi:hypothetical protein
MAVSEPKASPKHRFRPGTDVLGDWSAPIIAFVLVAGIIFALAGAILAPAE